MLMTGDADGRVRVEHIYQPVLFVDGEDVCFGDFQKHRDGERVVELRVWKFSLARGEWIDQGTNAWEWGSRLRVAPERVRRLLLDGKPLPSTPERVERARDADAGTHRRDIHSGAERVTVNGTVYRHVTNSVQHHLKNDAGEPVTTFFAHADSGRLTYVTVSDNDTVKVG